MSLSNLNLNSQPELSENLRYPLLLINLLSLKAARGTYGFVYQLKPTIYFGSSQLRHPILTRTFNLSIITNSRTTNIFNYQSVIFNDPIKLLEAIKQHALNFDETQYAMSIIANSVRAFFTTVQKDNESLTEYTRRFRTSRDIMESHLGGPLRLEKVVKGMKGYDVKDPDKVLELSKQAAERLYAFIHLENAVSV